MLMALNAPEFLHKLKQSSIDIILCDLHLKEMDSLDIISQIKKLGLQSKVIFLSERENKLDVINIIKAKANGYILKDIESNELYNAIKTCFEQGRYYNHFAISVMEYLMNVRSDSNSIEFAFGLTDTEIRIIMYLLEGNSSKEIGKKLTKSKSTIDKIRRIIRQKTGAKNLADLKEISIKNKFVTV